MATTIAKSALQQGVAAEGGIGCKGYFTVTPGTTATAGEAITSKLSPYFQSIESIKVCGFSTLALAKKVPVFVFTAGALLSAADVTLFWLVQDGDAGDLEPSNAVDLSAVGTMQIEVMGQPA